MDKVALASLAMYAAAMKAHLSGQTLDLTTTPEFTTLAEEMLTAAAGNGVTTTANAAG